MPHPVATDARPAAAAPRPPPRTAAAAPADHPMISQAHDFATLAFRAQVRAVLRSSSTAFLRRLLSDRVKSHFRELDPEVLKNGDSSVEDLLGTDPNVMMVSEGDMVMCYGAAKRVVEKWSDVLRRRGYRELAEVALDVAKEGGYLDPLVAEPKDEDAPSDRTSETEKGSDGNEYISPFTALHHGLRRHPPDCDGSGLPSSHLPMLDSNDADNNIRSSAREAIRQVDQMARGQSYWGHGWDAIEEASRRNRDRIDYSRVENAAAGEEDDEASALKGSGKRRRKAVQFKDDDGSNTARHPKGASILRQRKRQRQGPEAAQNAEETKDGSDYVRADERNKEDDDDDDDEAGNGCMELQVNERGRPPSSMGEDVALSWEEDVLGTMFASERRELIVSAIHPPHPFESEGDAEEDDECVHDESALGEQKHGAVVCGALKEIGLTHLWEQTRHLKRVDDDDKDEADVEGEEAQAPEGQGGGGDAIYGAAEARESFRKKEMARRRKRAMVRATKERLGKRVEVIREIRGEHAKAKVSKVKWTEDEVVGENKEGSAVSSMLELDGLQQQGQRRWLEMDLGECMIEVAEEEDGSEGEREEESKEKKKRLLAFRSLELALLH